MICGPQVCRVAGYCTVLAAVVQATSAVQGGGCFSGESVVKHWLCSAGCCLSEETCKIDRKAWQRGAAVGWWCPVVICGGCILRSRMSDAATLLLERGLAVILDSLPYMLSIFTNKWHA